MKVLLLAGCSLFSAEAKDIWCQGSNGGTFFQAQNVKITVTNGVFRVVTTEGKEFLLSGACVVAEKLNIQEEKPVAASKSNEKEVKEAK